VAFFHTCGALIAFPDKRQLNEKKGNSNKYDVFCIHTQITAHCKTNVFQITFFPDNISPAYVIIFPS
jgi:hypothetical protein